MPLTWTGRLPLAASVLAALAAMLVCGLAPADAAARRVPFGFFGTFSDLSSIRLSDRTQVAESGLMVRSGVESVRVLVSWKQAQGHKDFDELPQRLRSRFVNVGGVPTDFTASDKAIGMYAARGMRVLPVVAFSPAWASVNAFQAGAEPRDLPAYGRFVAALVRRYGPRGTFWRHHRVPFSSRVRQWQIWNEEDLPYMWTGLARDFAPGYVELLRAARSEIKAADPRARIVLGGLTGSVTWPRLWEALDAIYAAGGRGLFDVVAVHPYTRTPEGVLKILFNARAVMNRHGDRAVPLLVSEFSWSSRRGDPRRRSTLVSWEVSPAKQAANLARAYRLFVANRQRLRLEGAYWFTWLTNDRTPSWSYWTGLRRLATARRIVGKPSLRAFSATARLFEGCRKVAVATRCS